MIDFEQAYEKIESLDGINITRIIDFIELMKTARTSAFYSDELQSEYRSLNIAEVYDVFHGASNRHAIKFNIISAKLEHVPATMSMSVDYF